ncbi:LytTR family transcriptional regulator DNA-binding domain-containing protein [Maribacter antarcticus]|uniref:LytTR family transcriptional regulator DNA-binding domain-containing protein n=1 Tax=Maribacter antarcticus TaxID=505250 RepID=UPI000A077C27
MVRGVYGNIQRFYQIHKSHLINTAYIDKYLNEDYIVLEDNSKRPVSRVRRAAFLDSLK